MCGRFTRKAGFQQLAKFLGLQVWPHLEVRYNIAPSQFVACLRTNSISKDYECVQLKWGLVPSWAKEPGIGHNLINARAETVAEKPAFRKAFVHRRCLVLADGFYEWKREGRSKQPYYIHFADNRPFAFAGLWEHWDKVAGREVDSCTLITTVPNAIVEPIHQRMPVILHPRDYALWLDPSMRDNQRVLSLLQPHPPEEMEAFPVSPMVNNPLNESPQCLQR
jgi:putative SOS response-associated peptidase YedK